MRIIHTYQLTQRIVGIGCGQCTALLRNDIAAGIVGVFEGNAVLGDFLHQRRGAVRTIAAIDVFVGAGQLARICAAFRHTGCHTAQFVVGVVHFLRSTIILNRRHAVITVVGIIRGVRFAASFFYKLFKIAEFVVLERGLIQCVTGRSVAQLRLARAICLVVVRAGDSAQIVVFHFRRRAIRAGLKLVDCPIRHLGTEKAQQLYLAIQNYLADNGVEMLFNTECENIILENEECKGVLLKDGDQVRPVYADTVVIGTGRRGADWLEKICAEHHIAHKPGTVDIGVRVECRNEVMEKVNKVLYESKLIGYPKPWKNKVRTFCQNPGGFVAQENYDNDLAVVNGHSFKEKKSENTNLAILVSHNFTEPFNQPIAYAQKVGELTNMLGAGHIMVQRYGDILDGKRTWQKELAQSNVKPTLKDAVAGDITAAMPYRAMTNIIEFIKMLDMVVPGFAANETLLYSPELKFYSNKVKMDENLDTNIKGLHCLGDSSGWTRGLMMASVMGVLMGRKLAEKEGC